VLTERLPVEGFDVSSGVSLTRHISVAALTAADWCVGFDNPQCMGSRIRKPGDCLPHVYCRQISVSAGGGAIRFESHLAIRVVGRYSL